MSKDDLFFDEMIEIDMEAREILAELRELEGDRYE